ncbi:glycosyltransferase family 4 protein [Bythopirellula polymerisocia]|uniref:GDP-mannose-dependent alpha-(1-6)-phosphatidylinositol monomannoside mannosyltransferase n=1 Tax=Bythopirellula polymerisocia TaxID=2528003 RepID=A0A5C6D3G1_9BACT|nr:glycosyltransferase family 4 protein [Bythopirellula polymerisocia]TWU29766.1 GDP-mannose-dependent alpha-(1-6)-phosphatidylinositol monomannoside mannosyltransferase [Bythopirellula polymerisocia]
MAYTDLRKIAFVGDYLPRKCGIATFTHDLRSAVALYAPSECIVVPVDDIADSYEYPPEVRFQITEQDLGSYRRAADFLNFSDVDVVSLQHEFGIYGGPAGGHILAFLRDLRRPVVTTLHTVLPHPSDNQKRVMDQLIHLSARLVVMTERSRSMLREVYKVPEKKIDLIVHGIPDRPFADPNFYKDQFGVEGKSVGLTFGLLSPNKGIECVLKALPEVIREFPNFMYIILGATHPSLVRTEGETYRISLERMAKELGIQKHVSFYNRFVELHELTDFIGAADLYITPYLNEAQAVSGTLAYAFGCGQAVISTPYWHAEELLDDDRGVLVPFADSPAIAREMISLLGDDQRRHAMRKRAYLLGREMVWSHVAGLYLNSFQVARRSPTQVPKPLAVRTLEEQPLAMPSLNLDHLLRMTDSTGILQHACYSIPNNQEGYCTDDNARALILTVLLEELGKDSREVHQCASTYAAFLNYAFDSETGRFRNFMSYDRKWLEKDGSDDSQGRAIWALGTCIGRSQRRNLQAWAVQLFERALPACAETTSPRTWALALIGIHEYFRRLSGDRLVNQMREILTNKLIGLYENVATDDWPWFEEIASYNNARLSQALILSGRWGGNERALEIGLKSLRWLAEKQLSPLSRFRPIGSNGFSPRGKPAAEFDQQPIEAHAMVSAAIEARNADDDHFWSDQAHLAFDWFLGRNDLGQPLYDTGTGGCHDGLQENRLNENQGAESTLAFLLSLSEMELLESSVAVFQPSLSTVLKSTTEKVTRLGLVHAT